MDTIHHLLRLNVEIEGALRVLTTGDNEIALRILDEKVQELSAIVRYLAHPEEDFELTPDENDVLLNDKKVFSEKISFCQGVRPSDLSVVDTSLIPEAEADANSPIDNDEHKVSMSFNDPMAESEAIDRVLVMDDTVGHTSDKPLIETDKDQRISCDHIMGFSPVETQLEKDGVDPFKSLELKSMEITDKKTSSVNPPVADLCQQDITGDMISQKSMSQDPQKDKIRIDEMLSRREARDLSKAFTINDRFRFQLHIFGGNKEAFNTSIEAISLLRDYDSALAYLSGIMDIDTDDQDTSDFLTIIQNHFDVR